MSADRTTTSVFDDLGFSREDAAHLELRSTLLLAIDDELDRRGMTQCEAAELLGVSQPRVSDLRRGKIQNFSIDALVRMLARLGVGVELRLSRSRVPAPSSDAPANGGSTQHARPKNKKPESR